MNERSEMNWLLRFVSTFFSGYKWARKLVGGRWEEWWADAGVNAHVWLHEPRYLKGKNRPGGCAIFDNDPKPRRAENYSANEWGEGATLQGYPVEKLD